MWMTCSWQHLLGPWATDQDDLREALEKLKAGDPGTPVTLDSFLAWKTGKAEARKVRDDKVGVAQLELLKTE